MSGIPPVRAAVWGLGRAGRSIVEASRAYPGVKLVAGVTTSTEKDGIDLGVIAGGGKIGAVARVAEESVLKDDSIEVVLHAGLGSGYELAELFGRIAAHGKDVVTVSRMIHPVCEAGPEAAAELDRLARENGTRVVGTGVNPGFILDALPVLIATLAATPKAIRAKRITDMRYWGDGPVYREGGVGRAPGSEVPRGELRLEPSARVIADTLGGADGEVKESVVALVTEVDRTDGRRSIRAGETMGFERRARLVAAGVHIEVSWVAIFCLDPELDGGRSQSGVVEIEGPAPLSCTMTGAGLVDSYHATAARALTAVAPLRLLAPGVHSPAELPIAATLPGR